MKIKEYIDRADALSVLCDACGNCGGRFSTMELPVGLDKERGPSQRGPLRHKGRR